MVPNTLLLRLGFGIFLAMNIMVFSWAFYSCEWYADGTGRHDPLAGLFAYLLLLLSTILIATVGVPLAADAVGQAFADSSEPPYEAPARRRPNYLASSFRAARGIRLDTNALICIGVGAAYLISVIHTLRGSGSLYYDTAAMILVLVTLGYFLESTAKRKAAGAVGPMAAPPVVPVRVRRNGEESDIDSDRLVVGDWVYTRAGDGIVVDGVVVEGASHVDESRLTGESNPRPIEPGHAVLAGTINVDGPLWTRAQRVGDDRVIRRTERLFEEARMRQLPIQRLADRAASIFVPVVVVVAVGVLGWHALHGQATRGLLDALCVLLISCPCALGLAAPLASWSTLRRAAGQGIMIDSAATLERLAVIDRVFFDKTGTLTEACLKLQRVVVADGVDRDQALRWAAALESTSVHPIARSLVEEAQKRKLVLPVVDAGTTLAGLGIEGQIADRTMRLGGVRLAASTGIDVARFDEVHQGEDVAHDDHAACTKIYLLDDNRVLARFDLGERLRDGAAQSVARLRAMGGEVEMLSGDQPTAAKRIAAALDIRFEGALLPAEKLERVSEARGRGERVAMVGDGINDGPVLAGADVGFVMSDGADLAKQAGHVWLLSDRLGRIPTAIAMARDCMKRVRLNLAWAFGYNLIGVALAAVGLLTPIISAMAMIVSSLMIVTTSRHAGRVSPDDVSETSGPEESEDGRSASRLEQRDVAGQPMLAMKPAIVSRV